MTNAQILHDMAPLPEREVASHSSVLDFLADAHEPVVMRGLASNWPITDKANQSNQAIVDYLRECAADVPVRACMGEPDNEGRVFYNDDLSSMNFEQVETRLDNVLDDLLLHEHDDHPPTIYMGSTETRYCLPDFARDNELNLQGVEPSVRIWLGNQHRVAAHYDVLENIAVVGAGRRRFILFPPDQLPNLYVGPLDFTPAGQPVSMVDLDRPDFDRFPRFREALRHARTADLAPGDAIYIPSMWWHHVEGLERLNILVNHWWYPRPGFLGAPLDALMHAILSIRELPDAQKQAWRFIFDHYVFDADSSVTDHIPENSRGALAPLDEDSARRIRMLLRNKLNK